MTLAMGTFFVFVATFGVVGFVAWVAWVLLDRADQEHAAEDDDLLRRERLSTIGMLQLVLSKVKLATRLRILASEADIDWSPGRVVLAMLVSGVSAFAALRNLDFVPSAAAAILPVLVAGSPVYYLRYRKAKRLGAVEEQLPESLDFISRALVAGHSLPMALELLADEIGQPLSSELRKAVDEYNLGLSMEQSLNNLSERLPSVDIQFFASAITSQSRSGGSLHELLGSLSETIRERATLKGHVRALTANGRMSAIVLTCLPFFLAGLMMFVNIEYIGILLQHPFGKTLVFLGLCSQAAAFVIIRKIADVRV